MAFDFKKQEKQLYLPKDTPSIVTVPKMNFLAVHGKGDPNEPAGEYARAIAMLYPVAYTLKMSYKGSYRIAGFFEYVVPPLEGFWWIPGLAGMDATRKKELCWIALIRLPDFVTEADVQWAINEATRKKKEDFSKVIFFTYDEGLCVQCMHHGSYDNEAETTAKMEQFAREQGYAIHISHCRYHHEIYLSDPRKTAVDKRKTVVRHPIVLHQEKQ